MEDVQKSKPLNRIKIDKVGISKLRYPISLLDKNNQIQHTIAHVNVYIELNETQRGTHMSRFIEILNEHINQTYSLENIDQIVMKIKTQLSTEYVFLELSFPYFIKKLSPVSKKESYLDYSCKIISELKKGDQAKIFVLKVPITTLCPCSKEISEYGAHNQRGYVLLTAKINEKIYFEDLIKIIEDNSSCEIYPLLKRTDEKYVTEKAYFRPNFVEDIVRAIAVCLNKDKRLEWYKIECENYESIHNHNVYSCIDSRHDDIA